MSLNIPGVSGACAGGLTGAVVPLMNCLALTDLLPLLQSNGSIVDPVNNWLGKMCAADPCSQDSLNTAKEAVGKSCTGELSDPSSLISIVNLALSNYTDVRKAACSKDGNDYCVTQTLKTIESEGGVQVTLPYAESLLGGNQTAMEPISKALNSSKLCTTCVATLLVDASAISPDLLNGTIGQATTAKCGNDFWSKAQNGSSTGNSTSPSGSATSTTPSGTKPSSADQLSIATGTIGVLAAGVLAFSAYVL